MKTTLPRIARGIAAGAAGLGLAAAAAVPAFAQDSYPEHLVHIEDVADVQPGAEFPLSVSVSGLQAADSGTFLEIRPSSRNQFLDVDLSPYDNCSTEANACAFPDLNLEPGKVYEVAADTPVNVVVDDTAPGPWDTRLFSSSRPMDENLWWRFVEVGADLDFDSSSQLRLVESTGPSFEEKAQARISIVDNPYDIAMKGADVEGTTGEEKTLELTVSNDSETAAHFVDTPGRWSSSLLVTVDLPDGLAIDFPEGDDHFRSIDGTMCDGSGDSNDLTCEVFREVLHPGESFTLPLPTVITDEEGGEPGSATVGDGPQYWDEERYELIDQQNEEADWKLGRQYFESVELETANNTAVLTLNGKGADENAASSGGDDESESAGKLPVTGSSMTVGIAAAAAALAVGVGAMVWTRRRKTAATH
ncbi:LPXTG cell wall anchor domain-containing protein [Salininema proteolyticum]|uniref:LPXTG cell wall anchor domain-containing protein n=1 Tax=Salininema proteolyticum TaxID=1607685 RepID=A0ABV8TT58_9ACTN